MVYYMGTYSGYSLQHHGILGMKWGKRNGPPYPLNGPDHSQSEKKAGWRKSLSRSSKDEYSKRQRKSTSNSKKRKKLTPEQKRNIAMTVAALAVIGGTSYYLYKSGNGKRLVERGTKLLGKKHVDILGVPDSIKVPEAISETVKHTNPTGSRENCVISSFTGCLRQSGFNVSAKDVKIDPEEAMSKLFPGKSDSLKTATNSIKFSKSPSDAKEFLKKRFVDNADGFVCVQWKGVDKGHSFSFKIRSGNVEFYDNQTGITGDTISRYWQMIDPNKELRFARLDNIMDSIDWSAVDEFFIYA